MLILGDRAAVERFLDSPHGAATAAAMAAEVFADEERLAAFELGDDELPAPVEAALNRLIERRNREDR